MNRNIIKSNEKVYLATEFAGENFYTAKNDINISDYKKLHTKYIVFVFLSITFCVLFAISFYYNIVGGFEFERIYQNENIFGMDSVIVVDNFGSSTVSYIFDGNVVNGLDYSLKVVANISSNIPKCKLRARGYVTYLTYKTDVKIFGYTNWEYSDDGYCYLNQVANAGEKLGVCTTITMPNDELFNAQKNYVLTVVVEAVDENKGF